MLAFVMMRASGKEHVFYAYASLGVGTEKCGACEEVFAGILALKYVGWQLAMAQVPHAC